MAQREKAICLRTTDFSETSQVLHFLTRGAGVVRLLAKGTKRPKSKSGGALDLLSEGDLVFAPSRGDGLGALMEFAETTSHALLRRDARRLYAALYMIELAGLMVAESDPHPEVYDLLHNSLVRLAQPDAPAPAVLAFYQWRLLVNVGLIGQLESCAACGRAIVAAGPPARDGRPGPPGADGRPGERQDVHFSSGQGGLICRDCQAGTAEKLRLDEPALAGLAALRAATGSKAGGRKVAMPDAQADAINRMFAYHIACLLGKQLKLTRYVIAPPPQGA